MLSIGFLIAGFIFSGFALADFAWTNTNGGLSTYTTNALAYDTANNIVYAGTQSGVWRCINPDSSSPTWSNMGGTPSTYYIYSLAYDAARDIVYAGTLSHGMWRCTTPGSSPSWNDVTGTLNGDPLSLAFDSVHDRLYAGTQGSGGVGGVWRCANPDGIPTWANTNGGLSTYWIYSVAYDPSRNLLYAGTNGHSIWRCTSPNTSPSWTDIAATISGHWTYSIACDVTNNILYSGSENSGVWKCTSPDSSPSWTAFAGALSGYRIPSLLYDTAHRALYAGTGVQGVWQCTDLNAVTWVSTGGGISGYAGNALAYDSLHANIYAGTGSHGVWRASTAPHVSAVSPSSGPAGTSVTISGSNFGATQGSSTIRFNGKYALVTSWADGAIHATVPSGATSGPVLVTTIGGSSNVDKTFTVTVPTSTWYLAEGTTAWGFGCYITIENPNPIALTAKVTYMPTGSANVVKPVSLPAMSQTTINPADVLGQKDFSTKVECTDRSKTIAVDRTMIWTGPGAPSPEAHSSVGVTSPAATWYLPEGSTNWNFETWLLIQNPNSATAHCTVTYMTSDAGPRVVNHDVPANARASFSMAADIGSRDASIKVTSNVPVIPERAMYRNNRREGHDSIGTTKPASDYYLAEGTSAWGFTTYVLVQNPNSTPDTVILTYMTPSGPKTPVPSYTMQPNSRMTVRVNDVLPNTDFSTHVHGSLPVIAERSMYWGTGTALGEACHDSIGMAAAHTTFFLPDGQTSQGRETYTLVQNPNSTDVKVNITYLTPKGLGDVTRTETIKANSRSTFGMQAHSGITGRAAIEVTCITPGKKIMVERSMYWNNRGAGTDTIGGYSD